ncbi:MAG: SDR family oxidoreductase [Actinomycetota bacterium]
MPDSPLDPLSAFRLDGRVAVVTGASSGFGERFARVLAGAGASVVVAARRVERIDALADELPEAVALGTDVADPAACERLIDTTVQRYGRIDVLVNNAGLSDAPTRAEELDLETYRQVLNVNLDACFVLSQLAAKHMFEQGSGSIINIASVHGLVASAPNLQTAYDTSKHGLVGLTRSLAGQWARKGVRVNAIAPGYFETELTEAMFVDDDSGLGWIKRNTQMGRAGSLPELDGALLLLASDAGSYMSGSVVAVDGGWTAR